MSNKKVILRSGYKYKNIFLYASLQFCGNIEKYFVNTSKKLVVFIVMPRLKNNENLVRLYKEGSLVSEKKISLSSNILFYYLKWYYQQQKILFNYFKSHEEIIMIGFHPISFFGMSLIKLFRQVKMVYWIGDYFPGKSLPILLFERFKKHYHDSANYKCYLSDKINKVMNGRILETKNSRTIMWGVKPQKEKYYMEEGGAKSTFRLLFVGLIKDSQGLDFLFNFISKHREYKVNIVGICDKYSHMRYKKFINNNNLSNNIFFPNRFYSNEELHKLARRCHAGIALYNIDPSNPTFYTDPGKIKAYAEMWLPVIMTDVSSIVTFIKKFRSGIVIDKSEKDLERALLEIKANYRVYLDGVKKFNSHFNYEKYYDTSFSFLK